MASRFLVVPHEQRLCQRRLEKERDGIIESPLPHIHVAVDPANILEWHCLFYGLEEPHYQGGEYLFTIKLSPRYPFEPPDFIFLTPNGRFDVQRKLCFSNSSYHKESWSPMWTLRTILLGFLSFFLEASSKGVGHLTTTAELKSQLAAQSRPFNEANLAAILSMVRAQNGLPS